MAAGPWEAYQASSSDTPAETTAATPGPWDAYKPAGAAKATPPAAKAPASPASNVDTFKETYGDAARKVGTKLGVSPELILGQWGEETGWGKSIIPGTNNLGNIKGKDVSAKDNQLKTKDTYAAYKDTDEFADKYADMIQRKYPGVKGAGSDVTKFTTGLKGYAEDPKYAEKVSGAIRKVGMLNKPEEGKKPAPGASSDGATPPPKQGSFLKSVVGNVAAGADVLESVIPGTIGPLAAATGRWVAIAEGAQGEDISKFGHEFGQTVSEKLSSPVHKMLDALGVDMGYSESGVNKAMGKVSEAVGKGSEWLAQKTGMKKEDADDLVNASAMLVAPSAIKMTSKALLASGRAAGSAAGKVGGVFGKEAAPKAPVEEAQLREVPTAPTVNTTPELLAKQHIEETTGITKSKEQTPVYEKQRQADARAAFAEDPLYADYLKNYADKEASVPNQAHMEADKIEQSEKLQAMAEGKKPPTPPYTQWKDVEPIIRKPGFSRSAEDVLKLRAFEKQGGQADPVMLAKMAAIGLGVTAGVLLDPDNPLEGALLGGLGGAGVSFGASKLGNVGKSIKSVWGDNTKIRITDPMVDHQTRILKGTRAVWQAQGDLVDKVPSLASREKITHWVQGDKTIKLTDAEYSAAKDMRTYYNDLGRLGLETGALTSLLDDYVNQKWDLEGSNKAQWERMTTGMPEKSIHNMRRKIESIAEGKKLGLKPVTEDAAALMGMYGNSILRTIANRKFMDTLRDTPVKDIAGKDTGLKLQMPTEQAPKNYKPSPMKPGESVHPDIVKSLQFLSEKKSHSGILAGIEAVQSTVKRMEVVNPIFHIKNLLDVTIGAGHSPLHIIKLALGKHDILRQIREGGAGDYIDKAYEGGVMATLEGHDIADEDINGTFYKAMGHAQSILETALPGAGKLVEGYSALNKFSDKILWERVHAGGKMVLFSSAYDRIKENNINAHAKDSNVPLKSERELTGIAGRYTNTLFGGMNWMRAAEEVKSEFLRQIAQSAYSTKGRQVMQFAMFAPDWKISTTQALVDAFGKGTGIKGLIKPQELADLHRQFILRNAIYYATVGNAMNYAFSGHSIFENKDKTQLEWGDGRTMQFSKHMMDPMHLLQKPGQEALSAVGVIPGEVINQIKGTEYLSAKGAPPMDTSPSGRAQHALKKLIPMGLSSRGVEESLAGSVGFPMGGRTEEQAEDDKERAKKLRAEERERKLRERRGE